MKNIKFKELVNKINAKAEDIYGIGKYDFRSALEVAINKVLVEHEIDAVAGHDYGDQTNTIKIKKRGDIKGYWQIWVEFKFTRETISKSYYGNRTKYTLKSIDICDEAKTEIRGKETLIDNFADWLDLVAYLKEKAESQQDSEIAKLRKFMDEHENFTEMVELYNKYKYKV